MHLLIDADSGIYKAGLSNETREYHAIDEGGIVAHACQYKKDMDAWIEQDGGVYDVCKHKYAGPLSYSLANAKSVFTHMLDIIPEHTSYQLYISGEGNFRYDIYPDYKGKRKPEDRPIHEQEIRKYLIEHWGAEVVNGEEVDDTVSWKQCTSSHSTCIVSIDKDLLNTPGLNFNYDFKNEKGEKVGKMTDISPNQANLNFARQLLTGDATDNIPGLYKCGPVKARKLLPEYNPEWLEIIMESYKMEFGDDWKERLELIGQLLWMRRKPNEWWTIDYEY